MLLRCHLFSSYDALNGVPTHAYRDNARFASDLTLQLSRPSKVHSPKFPLPRSHPPQLSEAFCLGYYSFSSVFYIGLMIVPFFHFVKPFFAKRKPRIAPGLNVHIMRKSTVKGYISNQCVCNRIGDTLHSKIVNQAQ